MRNYPELVHEALWSFLRFQYVITRSFQYDLLIDTLYGVIILGVSVSDNASARYDESKA